MGNSESETAKPPAVSPRIPNELSSVKCVVCALVCVVNTVTLFDDDIPDIDGQRNRSVSAAIYVAP